MLAGQAWPDAPVCQLAASGLTAGVRRSRFCDTVNEVIYPAACRLADHCLQAMQYCNSSAVVLGAPQQGMAHRGGLCAAESQARVRCAAAVQGGGDRCAAAFGIPKVAMMFLAMGPFPHAAMWALWFQQAGGLLPADCMASAACGAEKDGEKARALSGLLRACGPASRPPRECSCSSRHACYLRDAHLHAAPVASYSWREMPCYCTP